MSDSKVFMIPDGINNNGQVDPNLLLTSMMNNGGFGGNGNWMWIIFLFFLFGWRGNGYGCDGNSALGTGYLSNQITNTAGRDLLMLAINGNGNAVQQLATTLNCDINSIKSAINGVQSSICQVGNQVGMSAADVKNAVTMGNMNIAQQIAQCCCDNKLLVTQMGYEGQLRDQTNTCAITNRIGELANGITLGFSSVAYETQRQTCDIKGEIKNLGTQISTQFGELATRALLDKLDAEREKNSTLMSQLSNEHQTALIGQQIAAATNPLATGLAAITREVDAIKCKLPDTATVPNPAGVLMPNCVAWNAGLFGAYPYGNGSIWS